MSIADFDAIIIRRKMTQKKKRTKAGLGDLDKEMKDMGKVSQSIHTVEKTGNNFTLHLKITLANKTVMNINMLDTTRVSEVISEIKKKTGITSNVFYLCELKENTQIPIKFYNSVRTLHQEKINDNTNLGYRMQWIAPFNTKQRESEQNTDYIYHCLKTTIFEESYPTERKIASALAAIAIQMTFGDFNEQESTLVDITQFCSPLVIQNYGKENLLRSSLVIQKKLMGEKSLQLLKQSFIQMAQKSHSYGATMFDSFMSGKKVRVGVVSDGIIVYLSDTIEDLQFYPIGDIKAIYSTGESAVVTFTNNKNIQIKTSRVDKLVQLLSGYYYLMGLNSPDVEKPTTLQYAADDQIFDLTKRRSEIVFLTNRLVYFFENIQIAAADACLPEKNFTPKKVMASVTAAIKLGQNLTSINFASTAVTLTQFTVFAESIDRTFKSRGGKDIVETFNAQELSLADNTDLGKTKEFATALCLIFKSPIALKRIDLSNIGLTDEVAKLIVDGFRACNSLEYLNLSGNPELSGNALQMILRSINKNALFRLHIKGTGITRQDAGQVIRSIMDFPNLQCLIMKDNAVSVGGAELGSLVQKLKKLSILDVRNCQLTKDITHSILKGLADSRVLKELRLSYNDGMGDVISYIADITEEGKAIKFPPITRLDVAGPDLGVSEVKKLLKILQRPSIHLNAIDIGGAKIKGDMGKIFDVLMAYERTQVSITQVGLNDCSIADSAIPNMVSYLTGTTKLTKLKIGYNTTMFRKGNYSFISDFIKSNNTLKNLHLSGLGLVADQIGPIFDAIQNHPSLLKLTFDNNPVGSYLNKITELLMTCQHLTVLRLRQLDGVTKEELINWLNNDLPQTMSVEKICLQKNGLTSNDIKKAIEEHPSIHFEL